MAPSPKIHFWPGRVLLLTLVVSGSVCVLLVFSMLLTENRDMAKANDLSLAANAMISAQMKARDPEIVPDSIAALASGSGSAITLFDSQGNPAYADTRILDKMKNLVSVNPDWYKAPHGPFRFHWPPPDLPDPLSEVARRMAQGHDSQALLANRQGQQTPILPEGGFALRVTPILNKPACATCHGYDENVLGHLVVATPIAGILSHRKTLSFWGLFPFSRMNQKILAGVSLSLFGIFLLILVPLDSYLIGRKIRKPQTGSTLKTSEKNAPGSKKPEELRSRVFAEGGGNPTPQEGETVSEEASGLLSRLTALDEALTREIASLPHPGIQSPAGSGRGEKIQRAVETFSDWSDKVEVLLMDLKARGEVLSDPMINRSIEKLMQLKDEAVALGQTVEEIGLGQPVPAFENLDDATRGWLETLGKHLMQIHGEIRALRGTLSEKIHPGKDAAS